MRSEIWRSKSSANGWIRAREVSRRPGEKSTGWTSCQQSGDIRVWRIGTHRNTRHLARHATDVFNLENINSKWHLLSIIRSRLLNIFTRSRILPSLALWFAYLSPRAPRAERVRAASEQTFSIGKQHLDIIATILHALPLVLAGIGLVFRRWPRGVFEGRQRR